MSDVFISYARSTASQAQQVAEALKALGYRVWRDDELPAHRAYADVIEERLQAAKAVVVIWSAEAVKSQWVQSEADTARMEQKLVQLTVDGSKLPRPFDRIQCADLTGWTGDLDTPGWRKVAASIADLVGGADLATTPAAADAPLPLPSKPSIAVMPFANLSGDPEQEYFADGMVVEITNALTRFKSLFVIASGSSLSFKGKGVSPQDAARQLGVRYVLEGSVRKAGHRVRITVQLIDTSDGTQIWSERFEDTLDDVFALQDRITLSVAGKIEPTVQSAEARRGSKRPTASLGSYDLYLRATVLSATLGRDGTLKALDLFNRASALDPDFGPALASAAYSNCEIFRHSWSDDPEGHRRRGLELAQRALKVSGDDADALIRVAITRAHAGEDLEAALALADRAIELNPGSARVWSGSSIVQMRAGQSDLAIEQMETAVRLDPISQGLGRPIMLGRGRFQQGRFSEAVGPLREAAQQTELPMVHALLAACLGHLGQIGEANAALARYRTLTPQPISDFALVTMSDPAHRWQFLEGIALAEGKGPAATEAKAE